MQREVQDLSRRSAERLAPMLDPRFLQDVELIMQGREAEAAEQFGPNGVDIAGLLVAIAALAWTILHDLPLDRRAAVAAAAPAAIDELKRAIKVRLDTAATVTVDIRDRIIDVVVDEAVRGGDDPEPSLVNGVRKVG